MTVKEFIKEAITIGDADDLLQFLTEKDFSVIEADFPTENHLAALLEYRGYDEEMDGIDDYYVELHFNYCLDTESDDYDDVEEEITGYCLSENWYELLEYGEDFYIWIHNDETEEEYVTEGVTLQEERR